MAAIKAAQLGLRVRHSSYFFLRENMLTSYLPDCMRGKARLSWRNMSECRMYTLKSHVEQLTSIPPSPA